MSSVLYPSYTTSTQVLPQNAVARAAVYDSLASTAPTAMYMSNVSNVYQPGAFSYIPAPLSSSSVIAPRTLPEHTVSIPIAQQSATNFANQVKQLLYQQPLVIHTRILPPGVKADDPRLANARVMSERRYISEDTSLPHPAFTATLHPSLLSSSSEPATRLKKEMMPSGICSPRWRQLAAFLCFSFIFFLNVAPLRPAQDVSLDKLRDLQHSFDPDENAVELSKKWLFGGASIPTKENVILLPPVANRYGYMWSNHPMKTNNFEFSFQFEFTDPANRLAFNGTRGFALWFTPTLRPPPDLNETHLPQLFGGPTQFSGLALFVSLFNSDMQQKSSISVALEDGTRSWDPLRDIPTKKGVFWRAITSGRPIVCKLVASPTGIMVTGQEKDVATWTSLFNFTGAIPPAGYVGFTAYSGPQNPSQDLATSLKAVGITLSDITMFNMNSNANEQTGAFDNLQDNLHHQVADILQLNAKAASPKELAVNVKALTKAVVKLIVETLPIQQQVRHTLTAIETRLDRLNSDIAELARRLEVQDSTNENDPKHHRLFQSVAHEISGLKNLFHHHSAQQARVTETLLEASKGNAKPAASPHLHTIEERLQRQAHMGWFMFLFLFFTVVIAMFTIWKKTREIEKKHLF